MKKITFDLPEELIKELKLHCMDTGMKVSFKVKDIIKSYLSNIKN